MDEPQQPPRTHIRPRVKHRNSPPKASFAAAVTNESDGVAEHSGRVNDDNAPTNEPTPTAASSTTTPTKGILKSNPKYTTQLWADAAVATAAEAARGNDATENDLPQRPTAAVKETIVERKVSRRRKNTNKAPAHAADASRSIEGYVPKTSTTAKQPAIDEPKHNISKTNENSDNNNGNNEEEDLVFDSLADLMHTAGTLPDQTADIGQEGTVVEADLEFSVMSPEEFAAQLDDQDEGHADVVEATETTEHDNNPAEDNHDDHPSVASDGDDDDSEKENSESGGGGFSMMELMDDSAMEPVETRPDRTFLVLWKALSQWVTPEAVAFVRAQQALHNNHGALSAEQAPPSKSMADPSSDTRWSDVESTRCAGLMSLLQLSLGPCLQDDLQRPLEERRQIEHVLGQLLRCLDYTQPSPKLGASEARALTCVLLVTLLDMNKHDCPPSCRAVGLTTEEYQYLVQRGIVNFGAVYEAMES